MTNTKTIPCPNHVQGQECALCDGTGMIEVPTNKLKEIRETLGNKLGVLCLGVDNDPNGTIEEIQIKTARWVLDEVRTIYSGSVFGYWAFYDKLNNFQEQLGG